ncbi:hypothetical protein ACTMTI_43370 [Nonomuraea sp. H19]|uniref:hypothetical protein n=1 Tax=Nonomuraea sp. H19 TaxID=3452206 RepID=UPI003F8B7ED1
MTARAAGGIIAAIAQTAGLDDPTTAHVLRHTLATILDALNVITVGRRPTCENGRRDRHRAGFPGISAGSAHRATPPPVRRGRQDGAGATCSGSSSCGPRTRRCPEPGTGSRSTGPCSRLPGPCRWPRRHPPCRRSCKSAWPCP